MHNTIIKLNENQLTFVIILVLLIIFALIATIYSLAFTIKQLTNNTNKKELPNIQNEIIDKEEPTVNEKKFLSIEDIKDEDMLVALLVATIDYANETKKDAKLISIRQVN